MSNYSERDMTMGSIWKHLLWFVLPMSAGLFMQQLYSTVDTIVVGNFIGKEALAAVGCNASIIKMLVGTFAGFATGAGIIVSQTFGAHDTKKLEKAVHTTMCITFILCVVGTTIGLLAVRPLLVLNRTPSDVFSDAAIYLTTYFYGLPALMIYNIGTAILRAVGDSTKPLIFLVISALINTVLDLIFVIWLHTGVEGVALATIIAELISAILVICTLSRKHKPYSIHLNKLCIDKSLLKSILKLGLPSAVQSGLIAFSNVFVQGYINNFGSACMAGWTGYNKIDSFISIPIQAFSMGTSTFVGQNWGARNPDRARKGVKAALLLSLASTAAASALVLLLSKQLLNLFSNENDIHKYGIYFINVITPFYLSLCFNQIYSGALRGIGNAKSPTVIMLLSLVLFRQFYLFISERLWNTLLCVALAYPVAWGLCSILLFFCYRKSKLHTVKHPSVNN